MRFDVQEFIKQAIKPGTRIWFAGKEERHESSDPPGPEVRPRDQDREPDRPAEDRERK